MTLLADISRRILAEAARSEHGIVVRIETAAPITAKTLRAKQVLYRFKKDDPQLDNISIRLAPNDPDNFLWLVKGKGSQ